MGSSDEVNLKSRFFRVGESSRKDFTFKSFLLLCLELGDSCKLKPCTFVFPIYGKLDFKMRKQLVVINRHGTAVCHSLTSLVLVLAFFSLSSSSSLQLFFWRATMLSVAAAAVSWSCSKFLASQTKLPQVFLPDLLFSNEFLQSASAPDALTSLSASAMRKCTLWRLTQLGLSPTPRCSWATGLYSKVIVTWCRTFTSVFPQCSSSFSAYIVLLT